HLGGRWVVGTGEGTTLRDPVTGEALVRVSSGGLDLRAGFRFAREHGGAALRALPFGERAERLSRIVKLLQSRRDGYFEIATANSGTVKSDSAVDIDGAIYPLAQFAKWGAALGDARALLDGPPVPLSRDGVFQSQHLLLPTQGLALFINAFNFPA